MRDGWGMAFYQGKDVELFREPVAASTSPLVTFLEHQGPSTTLAISHIRHATQGGISLANTQPFMRELGGHVHVFAHNGDLPAINRASNLAYDRFRPVGTTDSEHAFCALLERLVVPGDSPSLEVRLKILAEFAEELLELGSANFLYADGDTLFAFGDRRMQSDTDNIPAPGLYLYSCRCEDEIEHIHTQGVSLVPGYQEVVLVASVPLTGDSSLWRPFYEGELLALSDGRIVGKN